MGILLKRAAKLWFDKLNFSNSESRDSSSTPIRNWAEFKQLFEERFKKHEGDYTRDVMDFFQLKQGVNESIEEYILQMQLKGKSAHMAENLLKHAILGGLRNEIRQVVMMHQIDTIEDINVGD